jgi:hypothetical protein
MEVLIKEEKSRKKKGENWVDFLERMHKEASKYFVDE